MKKSFRVSSLPSKIHIPTDNLPYDGPVTYDEIIEEMSSKLKVSQRLIKSTLKHFFYFEEIFKEEIRNRNKIIVNNFGEFIPKEWLTLEKKGKR